MKVFLSYRRADSGATAGRMAQFLDSLPAIDKVFLDVDDIEIGGNFVNKIQLTLERATHAFLLIGSQWTGPASAGAASRVFQPDDFVHQETRMALEGKVKVVPILLDGATMPHASELPDDLADLVEINAFSLRTSHFDEDMDDLLDKLIGGKKGRASRWRQKRLTPVGVALRMFAGTAVGAAGLIVLTVVNRYVSDDCFDLACTLGKALDIDESDASGLMWMIVVAVLVLSAFAPLASRLFRRKH